MALSLSESIWGCWVRFRRIGYSWWWRMWIPGAPSDIRVTGSILIDPPQRIRIGRRVVINEGVYINTRALVVLGDDVHLSSHVHIHTGGLDLGSIDRPHVAKPVIIQNNVWIASGVTIVGGVTIHTGAVVGAGAVVTHDLPPYTLCLGIPARPVRDLPR